MVNLLCGRRSKLISHTKEGHGKLALGSMCVYIYIYIYIYIILLISFTGGLNNLNLLRLSLMDLGCENKIGVSGGRGDSRHQGYVNKLNATQHVHTLEPLSTEMCQTFVTPRFSWAHGYLRDCRFGCYVIVLGFWQQVLSLCEFGCYVIVVTFGKASIHPWL